MNTWKTAILLLINFLSIIPVQAIITDPEDHVYYYSGTLAPSRQYDVPDFLGGQDWHYGTSGVVLHRSMYEHFGLAPTDTAYALVVNNITGVITLDLPFCDSIFIEFWGTGRRGIHITNNLNSDYAWNAAEGNQVVSVGGRFRIEDSVKLTLTPTGLEKGVRPTGFLFINSIKIYGMIEEGDVPVFDGLLAGWDFKYRPKASGTVDLNELVTTEDGVWETDCYALYASDLGVLRGKLSYQAPAEGMQLGHDCGQQAVMLDPAGKNVTAQYDNSIGHDSYFQIELSTLGYQELNLAFDFNLRESADSLVVVYSVDNAATWSLSGIYPSPEDYSEMTSVDVDIPELTNKAKTLIRLLPANGDYDSNGQFLLANLNIYGYEYRPYKPEALNLAYINTAENLIRIAERAINTKDSTDVIILPALMDRYNVDIFYPELYAGVEDSLSINALFKDYDVVVLSDFPQDDAQITSLTKYLVGNKPLLNLKANSYSLEQGWSWGNPQDAGRGVMADTAITIDQAFRFHPLFRGLNIDQNNKLSLFDTIMGAEQDCRSLQGFVSDSYLGPDAQMIASPSAFPALTCVHEINNRPEAKYLLLGISSDQYGYISHDARNLIFNAVDYLGTLARFALPEFEMTVTGARVRTLTELKAALAYDYGAMQLDEIVIELLDCQDESGVYLLTDSGLIFPQNFKDLTLKAAEGHQPVLFGSVGSNNGMKVRNLRFERLTFDPLDSTITGLELVRFSPFYLSSTDSITGSMLIRQCSFRNMPAQYLLYMDPAGPALISELCVEQCTVENWSINDKGQQGGLVYISAEDYYQCDRFIFRHNIIRNFAGDKVFALSRKGTSSLQPDFLVNIENNLFYNFGGKAGGAAAFLEYNQDLAGNNAAVYIKDNLFYQHPGNDAFPHNKLEFPSALAELQVWTVEVLNNYFCPDTLMCLKNDSINLPSEGAVEVVYHQLLCSDFAQAGDLFEDESILSISKASHLYMAGTGYDCVGPEQCYVDRRQAGTLRVNSAKELEKALEIAIGGDIIELGNCVDAGGRYLLGNSGKPYPCSVGSFTIKAASGQQPVLFGRLSSNNGMKVDTLLIEGLTWDGGDKTITGYNADSYAPFYINRADSIMSAFIVRNCTFQNLDYQPVIRTNGCKGALIGALRFEDCTFDNMGWERASGNQGYHFMQFDSRKDYQLDHVVFQNNIVKNFHGSQLFNFGREGSTSMDSVIRIFIEHNTFYKLGGNGTTQRQFLGFGKNPKGLDVQIRINNNLFYKRWSRTHYSISNLALFNADSTQQMDLEVLNNFFYPEDVVVQKYDNINLEVVGSNIIPKYNNLYMSDLYLDKVFDNEDSLLISATSPLFTSGTDGSYIGAIQCYTGILDALCVPLNKATIRVYSKAGMLYIHAEQEARLEIFNLLGQKIRSMKLAPGQNCLEGLAAGKFYLLKIEQEIIKFIIQ